MLVKLNTFWKLYT